jgi:hypothetical protein
VLYESIPFIGIPQRYLGTLEIRIGYAMDLPAYGARSHTVLYCSIVNCAKVVSVPTDSSF